ncbi:hypothetical protein Hypma_002901 [Hypsizygus marmoreus]|uniref:F-box domain-containing protein n=1 Tax=Hypsizygus marmoreus TaxID=39966 RepID=A0A369J9J1_HYPMA|nr:hypothetical protein Hypma_002901 [Hypsizygus marmoreus]
MESSNVLPQELLDKIVDCLHNDLSSLKSCALSFRSLLPRSQSHIFSHVHISKTSPTSRLHAVLSQNPGLAKVIRELEISYPTLLDGYHPDLPHILHLVTSLESLSINLPGASWINLSQDLQDALLGVFGSHALSSLSIVGLTSIPPRFLTLRKSLKFLRLHSISFAPADPSSDYSQMTCQSLELSLWNARNFLTENVESIILPSGGLFSHIQVLTIHNISRIVPLALPIMRYSLEHLVVIELKDMEMVTDQSWFTFDFDMIPNLQRLAFSLGIISNVPQYFHSKSITTLRKLRNFVSINPSVSRIPTVRLSLTAHPITVGSPSGNWATIPEFLSNSSHWTELDNVLDAGRRSASPGCRFEISLELPFRNRSEVSTAEPYWRASIAYKMRLTDERGALFCEVKQLGNHE